MNSFKQFIGPLSRHVPPSSVASTSSGGEAVLRNGRYIHSKIAKNVSWTASYQTFADDHTRICGPRFADDTAQAFLYRKPRLSFLHNHNASLDRAMELGFPFRDWCKDGKSSSKFIRRSSQSATTMIDNRFHITSSPPILETRSYASMIEEYSEDMENKKKASKKGSGPRGLLSKLPFDVSALSRSKQKRSASKSPRQVQKKNKPPTPVKKRDYFTKHREILARNDPPQKLPPSEFRHTKGLEGLFSKDPGTLQTKPRLEEKIQNLRIVTSENNIEIQIPIRAESSELEPSFSVVSLQLSVRTQNNSQLSLEACKSVRSTGSSRILAASRDDKPPDKKREKREGKKSHLPWWAAEECEPDRKPTGDNLCLNEVYPKGAPPEVEVLASEEKNGPVDVAPAPAVTENTQEETLEKSIKKKKKMSAVAKATKHLEETLEQKKDELKKKASEEKKEAESKESVPNPVDPKKADAKETPKTEIKEPKDTSSKVVLKEPRDSILEPKSQEKIFKVDEKPFIFFGKGEVKQASTSLMKESEEEKKKTSEPYDEKIMSELMPFIKLQDRKPSVEVSQARKGLRIDVKGGTVSTLMNVRAAKKGSAKGEGEKKSETPAPNVEQPRKGQTIDVKKGTVKKTSSLLEVKAVTQEPIKSEDKKISDSKVDEPKKGLKIDVRKGTVSTLIKAKVNPLEKPAQLNSDISVTKLSKLVRNKGIQKPERAPEFRKSSSISFGSKAIYEGKSKKTYAPTPRIRGGSGKRKIAPVKQFSKREESKSTERAPDPFKPIEKKKDGTLIDYGFTVPTRKPKPRPPEKKALDKDTPVPAAAEQEKTPTTQSKPRLRVKFKAEKVEGKAPQALPAFPKPVDKPAKGTTGEMDTPRRSFSSYCGDGLLVEPLLQEDEEGLKDSLIVQYSPWLNRFHTRVSLKSTTEDSGSLG